MRRGKSYEAAFKQVLIDVFRLLDTRQNVWMADKSSDTKPRVYVLCNRPKLPRGICRNSKT